MAALGLDSLPYQKCRDHAWHPTRQSAQRAVKAHLASVKQGLNSCAKCYHGRRFKVWRCTVIGADHWHVGHQGRREEEEA